MSVLFLIGSFKRKLGPRDGKRRERKGSWLTYSNIWEQEAVPCWQTVLSSNKHYSMMRPQSKECPRAISSHKQVCLTQMHKQFIQCVPYSRGLLNSRGTPLEQLLSLQLAPVRKHPGPWWWCLPRTGPRRHRLWLPLAAENMFTFQFPHVWAKWCV